MQRPDSVPNALERFERLMPTTTAILVALTAWLFLQLDPLGLEQASNAASRRVAMRLMSAFYPVGNEQVSVVLIDDDYLRTTDGSWPMTYLTQGYLLQRVFDYQPRAVFVDILYRHVHASMPTSKGPTGPDPPTDLVEIVRRPPLAPVIFADLPPANDATTARDSGGDRECYAAEHATIVSDTATTSALERIVERARTAQWRVTQGYVGWQECGDRYPLLIGRSRAHPTPAFAVYAEACTAIPTPECATTLEHLERQLDIPISVRWGALPSPLHFEGYHPGECQEPAQPTAGRLATAVQRTRLFLEQFALSFAKVAETAGNERLRLPCPSIDTIRAGELMRGHPDRVRQFVKGRYVFVGVHLDGVQDQIASPVNGLVPGATFNAMALDNLLRLHEGYLRQWSPRVTRAAEAVLLILVVAIVVGYVHQRKGWFDTRAMRVFYLLAVGAVSAITFALGSPKIAVALLLLAVFAVVLPASRSAALMFACVVVVGFLLELALMVAANTAPGNWIGMLLAAAAGAELGKRCADEAEIMKGTTQ